MSLIAGIEDGYKVAGIDDDRFHGLFDVGPRGTNRLWEASLLLPLLRWSRFGLGIRLGLLSTICFLPKSAGFF